jgi:hypothetical protein
MSPANGSTCIPVSAASGLRLSAAWAVRRARTAEGATSTSHIKRLGERNEAPGGSIAAHSREVALFFGKECLVFDGDGRNGPSMTVRAGRRSVGS